MSEPLLEYREYDTRAEAHAAVDAFASAVGELAKQHGIGSVWFTAAVAVKGDDCAGLSAAMGDAVLLMATAKDAVGGILSRCKPADCGCAKCAAARAGLRAVLDGPNPVPRRGPIGRRVN